MKIKITDLSKEEQDLVKGTKKVKVICPHCKSKNTELMLAHYPIRTAVFICNSCNRYFEKYFEIKEEEMPKKFSISGEIKEVKNGKRNKKNKKRDS